MEASEVNGIYENLKSDIHRYARSLARHEHEANDLVQHALLKALQDPNLHSLPDYKQRAWFFRVIKNHMIDISRHEKRLCGWEDDLDVAILPAGSGRLEITELLGKLPPELSDIVFKRYWLGLSSREIGEQLGMPAATVRYKLQRSLQKLKKAWEDDL